MAEKNEHQDIPEEMDLNPSPSSVAGDSVDAANEVKTSSEKDSPSFGQPLQFVTVDPGSLRNILLGNPDGASVSSVSAADASVSPVSDADASVSPISATDATVNPVSVADASVSPVSVSATSPKKKKKKRPKSAQASSSSGSGISNPTTGEGGAEVHLTESLDAMSVSDAPAAAAAAPAAETKPKKKKKKKDKRDSAQSAPDAGSVDAEMNQDAGERESNVGEQRTEEQSRGMDQAPSNLQRLTQNLLKKQKKQPYMPTPVMQNPALQAQRMQYMAMSQQMMPPHMMMSPQMSPHMMMSPQMMSPHMMPPHMMSAQMPHGQQPGMPPQMGQQPRADGRKQQQQRQKGNNSAHKNQQKKNIFEPYWSQEDVAAGLKRGTLIQGPIRINPKNYEDAYVPLPDGTADIYISGMADRNRALNGDEVAVLVGERDSWRVFTEDVNDYEKCNSPQRTERASGAEKEAAEPEKEAAEPEKEAAEPEKEAEKENMTSKVEKENGASKDATAPEEDPDVLVEEEVEVELDCTGKPIEDTLVTNPVTGSAATPVQATPTSQTPTSSTQEGGKNNSGGRGARPKDKKGCNKNQGSNYKAKRYTSVKDMMAQASPVVQKLFDVDGQGGEDEGGERSEIDVHKFMQRTGKVVAIIERKHSRAGSGSLRPMQDPSHNFAVFAPNDARVPRIMIPVGELPQGFKERPEDFARILYIARITDWNESSKMPRGTLARSLGEAGQLEPETEAILLENNIDSSDFSDKVLACLPQESPWTIPAKELEWRRDLRRECIFSIDPSTARDLDDALHCTDLGDGTYEVGVHIADVSFFVEEDTELDQVANQRATSVYLVQKVIPMLPRLLCEQLCSLNPDEDRLSFSVIWKLTEDGEILEEWFGRTVIRSCVKLSYDHAQGFIEEPEREWTREELPPISEGFSVDDIKRRVLQMDKIAKALRKARFDSGALRLDQVKLQFTLNKESGLPNGYFVYQQRDSNKLVEEFMLLANMAVAHKIRSAHREQAVLRRHPPPQSRMINDLKELCHSLGFPVEVNSAKDIQLSLARYTGEDELSQARLQILVALCSRPMRNAKYFCCGMLADEALYSHYALNVPLYTHFTSPIRRYPDILVHRTLAAALGYCDVTNRHAPMLQQISDHCNNMKTNAKQCSERSNELYFAIFVKEAGPLEEKGMVMQVLDKSFDVFILRLGVVKRVYCERLPLESFSHQKQGKRVVLTLVWKPDDGCSRPLTQRLAIFTAVHCVLQSEPEPLKWSAFIHRPVDGDASIVA